jgi:hypothetical protein
MTTDTDPRVADLPPLPRHGVSAPPRPHYEPMPLYTASQMREYALAALAKVPSAPVDAVPVAEIVSADGDPESFGERRIEVLVDLKKLRYGTKLFALTTSPEATNGRPE